MTLLDIIRRAESGCNRQERLREKLSRRRRDRLVSPLSLQELTRGEKTKRSGYAITLAQGSAIDRIAKRASCLASVSELDSRRCILLHLTTSICRIERSKRLLNETRTERGCGTILCAASFGTPSRRRYVTEPIFTDVNFRAVCYCSPYADDVYRNRALFRCPVTSRARGPSTGMRFAAVISFRDRIPETQRFAGSFQQQRASLHIRLRRISLCAQISAGRPAENSDICFPLLVVPPMQARVVLKCIKQQQLTRYQVRVSWEEVGDRCGPGNDWSRVPLALESRRRGFPPSIPCSNRKIPWITDVIS